VIEPETWKEVAEYSGKAWSAVGPLVGVLIGAYLATRNERKHWIRDNERLEFRELLSTMARSFSTIVNEPNA
jgi:hypothetical protein